MRSLFSSVCVHAWVHDSLNYTSRFLGCFGEGFPILPQPFNAHLLKQKKWCWNKVLCDFTIFDPFWLFFIFHTSPCHFFSFPLSTADVVVHCVWGGTRAHPWPIRRGHLSGTHKFVLLSACLYLFPRVSAAVPTPPTGSKTFKLFLPTGKNWCLIFFGETVAADLKSHNKLTVTGRYKLGYICFCEWPQECSQTSGGDNKRRRGRVCGGDVDVSPGLVYMADPSSFSLLPSSFPKEMKERARKRKINHQPLVWSLNKMDWK